MSNIEAAANQDWLVRVVRSTLSNIETKAKVIQKSLGTRVAAGFLRNRGYTLEQSLKLLGRKS